jgi:hypothetical protein
MVQCVICKDSKLEQIDVNVLKCKICHNKYVLGYEILKHEDEITDPYSDDPDIELSGLEGVGNPILLSTEDEFKSDNNNNDSTKSDIKIPDYMKNTETTTVEYRED